MLEAHQINKINKKSQKEILNSLVQEENQMLIQGKILLPAIKKRLALEKLVNNQELVNKIFTNLDQHNKLFINLIYSKWIKMLN